MKLKKMQSNLIKLVLFAIFVFFAYSLLTRSKEGLCLCQGPGIQKFRELDYSKSGIDRIVNLPPQIFTEGVM